MLIVFIGLQAVYREEMLDRDLEDLQKRYQVWSNFFCFLFLTISYPDACIWILSFDTELFIPRQVSVGVRS